MVRPLVRVGLARLHVGLETVEAETALVVAALVEPGQVPPSLDEVESVGADLPVDPAVPEADDPTLPQGREDHRERRRGRDRGKGHADRSRRLAATQLADGVEPGIASNTVGVVATQSDRHGGELQGSGLLCRESRICEVITLRRDHVTRAWRVGAGDAHRFEWDPHVAQIVLVALEGPSEAVVAVRIAVDLPADVLRAQRPRGLEAGARPRPPRRPCRRTDGPVRGACPWS